MKNNVLDYFEQTRDLFPNKVALNDGDTQFTFLQMWEISEKISHNLTSSIPYSEDPQVIAIYLPKSYKMLMSFFGILMSGHIYMPLDTKAPLDRTKNILKNIQPIAIISTEEYAKNLEEEYIDFYSLLTKVRTAKPLDLPYKKRISTDPIYIINTSGSTGVPKGVVVSHQNVIDYMLSLKNIDKITPTQTSILGNQVPFCFDVSVHDIYSMFFYQSQLVLIPEEYFALPNKLLEFLADKPLNYLFWVPSALKVLNIALQEHQENAETIKDKINTILFAGEIMPTTLLTSLRQIFKSTVFANFYGPTETTVSSSYFLIQREFSELDKVPIGRALQNTKILLLDKNNQPSNQGEICIGGKGVSLGYYNNPVKTSEVFVQNPTHNLYRDIIYRTGDLGYFNDLGELVITGRKDAQIKFKGFRIELGEIEHALLGLEGLENFCVIFNEEIILATDNRNITKAEMFKHLIKKIPKYMFPTQIFYTPIPLNQNGKIDRKRVLELYKTLP